MAILNLVLYPDDPLTEKSDPYEAFGPETEKLATDMIETMHVYEGVGLAGPQVGLQKRIITVHEPDGSPMCLVNPEILSGDGHQMGEEGCLSLPGIYADVPRAQHIQVRALDPRGKLLEFEASELLARIIQHECDHLEGVIFLDRLDILTRQAKLQEWDETRARLLGTGRRRGVARVV